MDIEIVTPTISSNVILVKGKNIKDMKNTNKIKHVKHVTKKSIVVIFFTTFYLLRSLNYEATNTENYANNNHL